MSTSAAKAFGGSVSDVVVTLSPYGSAPREGVERKVSWEGVEVMVHTIKGDEYEFRLGSNGGHEAWLQGIVELMDYGSVQDVRDGEVCWGPFVELILAEPEDSILTKAAAKLLRDFVEHLDAAQSLARSMGDFEGQRWINRYHRWMRSFEMAAKGGAVHLH